MEQRLTQAAVAIIMALMAWNFKTLNDTQLVVEGMMYKHAKETDITQLKLDVEKLKWLLQADAMEK